MTLKKIVIVGDGAALGGRGGGGMYQVSSIELIMVLIMGEFGVGGREDPLYPPLCIDPWSYNSKEILTGSKMAKLLPRLFPGTTPAPPTNAAPTLSTILPYKFGNTITSNWCGLTTSC